MRFQERSEVFLHPVLRIAWAVGWLMCIGAFSRPAQAQNVQPPQSEKRINPRRVGASEEPTRTKVGRPDAWSEAPNGNKPASGEDKIPVELLIGQTGLTATGELYPPVPDGTTLPFSVAHEARVAPTGSDEVDTSDDTGPVKQPGPTNQPFNPGGVIPQDGNEKRGFQWRAALNQSYLFLGIQHAFRFATEPSTRADLKGPFFRDYFASVGNLRGWRDGDEFYVNYVGHSLQGAVTGFIYVNNDPAARRLQVGLNKAYMMSRLKATAWSAVHSLQFELGPLSEASLGNVGLKPGEKSNHPMGYVDLVVTPVLGTAWVVGEDLLDRYVIRRIEDKTQNRLIRILARTFLNPSRTLANLLRGQEVWYRDDRYLRGGRRP